MRTAASLPILPPGGVDGAHLGTVYESAGEPLAPYINLG